MNATPLPPSSGPLILIVEDEPHIAEILEAYLRREGYRTRVVSDGPSAVRVHRGTPPALVLLDVALPGFDGYEVLRRIRAEAMTPVIMLTARDEDVDAVVGLRMGADDYVVKPFSPPQVVARVAAVLRRATPAQLDGPPGQAGHLAVGPVRLDAVATRVTVDDRLVGVTATEYRLLELLMRSPGRTFTRAQLLATALPDSPALERVVDAHLGNLRRKLRSAGAPELLDTVRGLGYRLRTLPEQP